MYGLDANNNEECKRWIWNNVGCNLDVYPNIQNIPTFSGMSPDDKMKAFNDIMKPKVKKALGYSYYKNIKSKLLDISNNTKSKKGDVKKIESDMEIFAGK